MKYQHRNKPNLILLALLGLSILSCAGLSDLPNPFATATPTATNTFTPSPTVTITPSPIPTLTPTPQPTGVQTKESDDGSTVLIDYDNQYQLTLPKDWLIIPFQKEDYLNAVERLADESPVMADAAQAFKDMDPKIFRVVALNLDPKFALDTFATNLNISAFSDPLLSAMPLEFVTGALEGSLEDKGATVLTTGVNVLENSHGVAVQYIDTERSVGRSKIIQRVIVFQSNNQLILINITTLKQFAGGVFSSGDQIASSIEYLK